MKIREGDAPGLIDSRTGLETDSVTATIKAVREFSCMDDDYVDKNRLHVEMFQAQLRPIARLQKTSFLCELADGGPGPHAATLLGAMVGVAGKRDLGEIWSEWKSIARHGRPPSLGWENWAPPSEPARYLERDLARLEELRVGAAERAACKQATSDRRAAARDAFHERVAERRAARREAREAAERAALLRDLVDGATAKTKQLEPREQAGLWRSLAQTLLDFKR